MIMSAVKRIPVTEPVWRNLAEMRSAGQTYTDLLAEMIEDRKKHRLEEDVRKWSNRKKTDYVSLSEIKD
jgi:predicted CopG family antitoxin